MQNAFHRFYFHSTKIEYQNKFVAKLVDELSVPHDEQFN